VAAANLTGHASNVTGAAWVVATASAGDGLAHHVTIRNDSVTNHSAKTVILTGKDANGNVQTETMNLPGASATVTSTKPFKELDGAVPSATIGADTMDIGWAATAVSPWVPLNFHLQNFSASVAVAIVGTINYDVQHTYDDINAADAFAFNHTSLVAKTANADGSYVTPVAAVRVDVNSHTGGSFTFVVHQGERL
jgi:archaellum component FlaF (FlaF/FlaG flagellin family)